jgi:hypothetical protein
MGAEEERELCDMIPRIVEQIRLRRGRRLREGSAGRVWMRGAFRESVRHGGVPFVLPLRERKLRRPRVVLLVDVSYSVIRCAGLFLLIALSFLRRHRSTRVVVFVDRAVEATGEMLSWARGRRAPEAPGASPITGPWRSRTWPGRRPVRPHLRGPAAAFRRGQFPGDGIRPAGGVSFMELLSRLPDLNLEAPSDYGRAFHGLGRRIRFGGRDTVLVVLGDGRTNRFDPLDWAFRDIADRCGRVIWLVPEERGRWGTGDSSLPAYLAHSDVAVETRDLSGLRRGVLEVLRGL